MAQNISVNFRVAGNELASYIDNIQKKSEDLTNEAIKGAREQAEAGKDQLKIINQIIAATERKNKVIASAKGSIVLANREESLRANEVISLKQKEEVRTNMRDKKISFAEGGDQIRGIDAVKADKDYDVKAYYKDSLTLLREEEKRSRLQTILTRENIDVSKVAAKENIKAIASGDKTLADCYKEVGTDSNEQEKLSLKLIEEGVADDKKKKDKENGGGIIGGLLAVDNLNRIISAGSQMASSKNGFDMIQPASNMAGRIIGGIIGGLVGSLAGGVGAVGGAGAGASIGGAFGDGFGALQQREAMSKEAFRKSAFRYQAISGQSVNATNMSDMSESGVDFTQYMGMKSEYARRRGNAASADKTTRDAVYLEKGYGLDQGTSAGIIEMQRSSREGNKDLASLIGGIIEKGQGSIFKNGDNTFLNEFVGKFATLQKDLLKTSTTVSTGITMDILSKFNNVGGMFSAKDPRSAGIISSIQGSLSNPDSDNAKALSFGIMRDRMPNKGIFDIREEVQKGLASPEYLKGTLEIIDKMGGDNQAKMNNVSGRFQGLPLAAVRSLWDGYRNGKLSKFDTKELHGVGITDAMIKGKSDANTSPLEQASASTENGVLSGQAIEAMAAAFKIAVQNSMAGAVIELKNGQGTINFKAPNIPQNVIKKPEAFKAMGYNSNGSLNITNSANKF